MLKSISDLLLVGVMADNYYKKVTNLLEILFDKMLELLDTADLAL